jgi:hypothetical protein
VKKPKRPARLRSVLRKLARSDDKIAEARAKLALLEPGGAPDRPMMVESASLVELRAEGLPCVVCGGRLDVKEHDAEEIDGAPLRIVRLACRACGAPRVVFFRIEQPLLN